jgi:hypothetical protein
VASLLRSISARPSPVTTTTFSPRDARQRGTDGEGFIWTRTPLHLHLPNAAADDDFVNTRTIDSSIAHHGDCASARAFLDFGHIETSDHAATSRVLVVGSLAQIYSSKIILARYQYACQAY